jgi:hypothetical protein
MEPEGSLPCSQKPYTGPCLELDQYSPYGSILSKIDFDIIHSPTQLNIPNQICQRTISARFP